MSSSAQTLSPTAESHPLCPNCHRPTMRRIQRTGFIQIKIAPAFGYFPWECRFCRIVKLFRNRGMGRRSRSSKS